MKTCMYRDICVSDALLGEIGLWIDSLCPEGDVTIWKRYGDRSCIRRIMDMVITIGQAFARTFGRMDSLIIAPHLLAG